MLSPEVGLAFPAAFLYIHSRGESSMTMILAPKLKEQREDSARQHVRVHRPNASFAQTKTFLFEKEVTVEYLEGTTRQLKTDTFAGGGAYCVQLLRVAFSRECWVALD